MIKYALHCDLDHAFEGWFRNSQDFEDQLADGHVQCPVCGSSSVVKSLMAPSVSGTGSQNAKSDDETALQPMAKQGDLSDQGKLRDMLRQLRQHVVDNSDYVGNKFAEEARKMHFNESEQRGIYGEATSEEVKSLTEDGIDCLPLPNLPEDQN